MSLTGKLQAVSARGYRLRWSVDATREPDYDRLTLALLDAKGSVLLSNSQRVKARGGVVTKESEDAQRNALVTWAEEVTRSPIPKAEEPTLPMPEPEPVPAGTEAVQPPPPNPALEPEAATVEATEGDDNGEEISGPVAPLQAQAEDPI